MITQPETMWIIVICLFLSFSMTAWATYLLSKEIKILKNFVKSQKEEKFKCQCGFETSQMKEMTNHIEEEGNTCRKFVKSIKEVKKE